ncbi:transposase [Rhodoblastus sphagnicola]|uniref:IS66-like element accessory protein TnpA n=1 Tax=Rhodoblastus sphagnicola TaxID=333368 RepID=UPI0016159242|nr:transposase [Rhodoblastus sphagnicola]
MAKAQQHNDSHQHRHQGGAYQRCEVITGEQCRRDWTPAEKARIVLESADPDANISEVARRNGVSRGLLHQWRRQARGRMSGHELSFAAVEIEGDRGPPVQQNLDGEARSDARIQIELAGATIRVPKGVDCETLRMVLWALRDE